MDLFTLITPLTYAVLIVLWCLIVVYILREYRNLRDFHGPTRVLVVVLAIDAVRTLFESIYFGSWYSARVGYFPQWVFELLVQPQYVFIPKIINVIAALLIFLFLILRWIPELARTEKNQAKQFADLQESEARFRNYFELGLVGMAVTSPEKGWVQFNDRLCEILGQTRESLAQVTWASITHPDDMEKDLACFNQVMAGETSGYSMDKRFIRPDGGLVHASISVRAIRNADHSINHFVAMVHDITERKRQEERRQNNLKRLNEINRLQEELIKPGTMPEKFQRITQMAVELFDQDFCRLWVIRPGDICNTGCLHGGVDTQGEKVCENRRYCLHLEASSGRYTQLNGTHQRVPLGRFKIGRLAVGASNRLLTNHAATDPQIHNQAWAKKLGLISFAGYKVRSQEGKAIGVLAMFSKHVMTEEEQAFMAYLAETASHLILAGQAEGYLRQSKKDAEEASKAKSDFLATMSHEIRTPMNAILGMTELLKNTHLSKDQDAYLVTLTRSSKILLALIDDILDLSKIEAGQLTLEDTPFNLSDLVEEVVKLLSFTAQDKGISLVYHRDEQTPLWVRGDPTRLRQVLLNLIGNAVKFTQNGTVDLQVAQGGAGQIRFVIKDTGPGIPPKKQQRIFLPFTQADSTTTRSHGGTGLGLTICNRLVNLMGGRIHLESQVGLGSTFSFSIPLPPVSPESISKGVEIYLSDREQDGAITTSLGLAILLAEDVEENCMVIEGFLRDSDCQLTIAHNGLEAVEAFEKGRFDLILMDIQMPKMDGYAATRAIRQREKGLGLRPIPIIALTAHALQGESEQTQEAGCDLHLTKPVSRTRLLEVLSRVQKRPESLSTTNPMEPLGAGGSPLTEEGQTAPGLSNQVLDQLRQDFAGEIVVPLEIFLEKLPERLQDVHAAIQAGNLEALMVNAHKVKGTAATFGAIRLSEIARDLERLGSEANLPEAEKRLPQFMAEGEIVRDEIKRVLSREMSS
ncbi:MAG: PAS domain S-box protein [Magnetococcales bacterium]|nr:PAS domain S-box protein [Magnetococcales bacterium]